MKKILVVSAHPDDEIIGMGGTLTKLSKKHNISILFLSDGITSRRATDHVSSPVYEVTEEVYKKMKKQIDLRKTHAKNALKIVGVKKTRFLDLPNNEVDKFPLLKIIKEIEYEIQDSQCEVIYTHHYADLNIDHRIAYEAVITAARPLSGTSVKSIISFEAISSTDWRKPYKFNPNMFVDITSELKVKIRAMKAYKNEIRKFPHPRSIETLEAVAKRWGSLYGYKAAEAFEIILTRKENFQDSIL